MVTQHSLPNPTHPSSPVARDVLLYLQQILGDQFPELLNEYFDDMGDRLRAMEQALKNHDAPTFAREAHSLKGSSSNMGAWSLANACDQAVRQVRSGNISGLVDYLQQIDTEAERTRVALREAL